MWLHEQGITGAQVMLACEDYPSLLDRQISKIRYEFPRELGELKESATRDFVLNHEYGNGRILLRNLDDPAKYLSAEFAGIALDELTRNELSVFNFLRSRLRWTGVKSPRFVAGTNPGGKGHGWVKDLWIERNFPMELRPLEKEFYFVPAKAADNPFLSQQYYEDLKTLPADMAKAYAEGSWEIFAGQFFSNWEKVKDRVVVRAESVGIKPWWPKWMSIDWGFEHEACIHWHTTEMRDAGNRHTTYREKVINHLSPVELAKLACELNGSDKIESIYLSPDAFAKRTSEEPISQQMGEVFRSAGLPYCSPADDDRVGGWMLMYHLLDTGEWQIADNCRRLVKNIPVLTRDPKKVEDVLKVTGDDPADCARYGLKSRLDSRDKPYEYRLTETLDAIPDYTQKHIMHLKMEDEHQEAGMELQQLFRRGRLGQRWKRRHN